MTSIIKVNNLQNQCGANTINKCGTAITVGASGDTTTVAGNILKSNALQAADGGNLVNQCGTTITLGASGDTINLASGASQSGFGRTGTVDWDTTPKTATFTAVNGTGYFVNTTAGVITVNLPAGSAGNIVSLADYAATWQTYNVTVAPNGTDKIGGTNATATLNVEGQSVTFVYVDSTQGWVNTMDSTSNTRGIPPFVAATVSGACNTLVTVDTDYKLATFVGPGTFTVTAAGTPAGSDTVDYLVVGGGGGGGGGGSYVGGGAGGGAVMVSATTYCGPSLATGIPAHPVSVTAYPITVGGGGVGAAPGTSGNNSIFSSLIAAGGGRGGRNGQSPNPSSCSPSPAGATPSKAPGNGSGGGGSSGGGGTAGMPGGANGNPGGNGSPGPGGGGGGGGATSAGSPTPGLYGGGAGAADATTITGTPANKGAGGSGSGNFPGGPVSPPGPANSGEGGSGAGVCGGNGATGGSGIVVIRYKFQ